MVHLYTPYWMTALKGRLLQVWAFLMTRPDYKSFIELFKRYYRGDLYKQLRAISNAIIAFSVIGYAFACAATEMVYLEGNTTTVIILKTIVTWSTFTAEIFLSIRYVIKLQLMKKRDELASNATLLNTPSLAWPYFGEFVTILLHVPPGVSGTINIFGDDYPVEVLSVVMLGRLYLTAEFVRNQSSLFTLYVERLGALKIVNVDSSMAVRSTFELRGEIFVLCAYVLVILYMSWWLWMFEGRTVQSRVEWETYWDSFYLTIITMTTVGYGDLFAQSVPGRVVTVSGGTITSFMQTLVTNLVFKYTQLTVQEYRVINAATAAKKKSELEVSAANMIRRAFLHAKWQRELKARMASGNQMKKQLLVRLVDGIKSGGTDFAFYMTKAEFNKTLNMSSDNGDADDNARTEILLSKQRNQAAMETWITSMENKLNISWPLLKQRAQELDRQRLYIINEGRAFSMMKEKKTQILDHCQKLGRDPDRPLDYEALSVILRQFSIPHNKTTLDRVFMNVDWDEDGCWTWHDMESAMDRWEDYEIELERRAIVKLKDEFRHSLEGLGIDMLFNLEHFLRINYGEKVRWKEFNHGLETVGAVLFSEDIRRIFRQADKGSKGWIRLTDFLELVHTNFEYPYEVESTVVQEVTKKHRTDDGREEVEVVKVTKDKLREGPDGEPFRSFKQFKEDSFREIYPPIKKVFKSLHDQRFQHRSILGITSAKSIAIRLRKKARANIRERKLQEQAAQKLLDLQGAMRKNSSLKERRSINLKAVAALGLPKTGINSALLKTPSTVGSKGDRSKSLFSKMPGSAISTGSRHSLPLQTPMAPKGSGKTFDFGRQAVQNAQKKKDSPLKLPQMNRRVSFAGNDADANIIELTGGGGVSAASGYMSPRDLNSSHSSLGSSKKYHV